MREHAAFSVRYLAFPFLAAISLIAATGCKTVQTSPEVQHVTPDVGRSLPWTAGVFVPKGTANYVYQGKPSMDVSLVLNVGPAFSTAVVLTMQDLFADAWKVPGISNDPGHQVPDVIVVPVIERVDAWFGERKPSLQNLKCRRTVEINAKWTLFNKEGKPVLSFRNGGKGWNFDSPQGYQAACEGALKYLLSDCATRLQVEKGQIARAIEESSGGGSGESRHIAILGWIHSPELDTMAQALRRRMYETLSERDCVVSDCSEDTRVRSVLRDAGADLEPLTRQPERLLELAKASKCETLLAGHLEQENGFVRLTLTQFDGSTGASIGSLQETARADDIEALMGALDTILDRLVRQDR